MKSLCIIAIGTLFIFGSSAVVSGQGWKDNLGLTKKGKVYAKDLTEEETMELLGGYKPDNGIVNEFHQSHLNQVVFTSKKMDPKDVTEGDIKTSFGINDPIYFTFYMSKSFRNQVLYPVAKDGINQTYYYDHSFHKFYHGPEYTSDHANEGIPELNRYGSHMIYVEIDGVQIENVVFSVDVKFDSEVTAFSGYILPHPSDVQLSMEMIAAMQKVSEGDHKVRVEIAGFHLEGSSNVHMTKDLVATGEFTLTRKTGEKFGPSTGKSFADFSAGMTDAALEKKFLAAVIAFGKSAGYKEQYSAVKIKDSKWYIKTHNVTGAILEKNIVAYCKSTFANGLCYVQEYIFRAQYNGTGYEDPYCSGVYKNSYPVAIDCE